MDRGRQELERRISWQHGKHAKLWSDFVQAFRRDSSEFSVEGRLISASAVPYRGRSKSDQLKRDSGAKCPLACYIVWVNTLMCAWYLLCRASLHVRVHHVLHLPWKHAILFSFFFSFLFFSSFSFLIRFDRKYWSGRRWRNLLLKWNYYSDRGFTPAVV